MIVSRFAPSPTGGLHLGHAWSAIQAHDRAWDHGGRFLLRIEDTDVTRSRPEHVAGILADLEWLVLPPVMAGQFRLGHATRPADAGKPTQGGISIPVAVALWARVSPEIDKALSENLDKHVRLRADEWATGENLWLMAAAGDKRAVPLFLKQLAETEFKDRHVKMRLRGTDGKTMVKTLGEST